MLRLKSKKIIQVMLCFIVIFTAVFVINPSKAEAIGDSRMFQHPKNPNIYYFVGMVYYDTWSDSAGNGQQQNRQDPLQMWMVLIICLNLIHLAK